MAEKIGFDFPVRCNKKMIKLRLGGLHFICSLANAQAVSKTYVTVQCCDTKIGDLGNVWVVFQVSLIIIMGWQGAP